MSKWLKIEQKSVEHYLTDDKPILVHYTEYTDVDGRMYTIYDMIPDPGFPRTMFKNDEVKPIYNK